jgi:hypothetical protein
MMIQKAMFGVTPELRSHTLSVSFLFKEILSRERCFERLNTEEIGSNRNISDLYPVGVQFESRMAHVLQLLRFPMILSIPSAKFQDSISFTPLLLNSNIFLSKSHQPCYSTMYVV